MSFTLSTLKTAVQGYLQVSETAFTNQLPRFIQESEDRIFSLVQLPFQRKNVQASLTVDNRFLATPTDFYAPFSLAVINSNTFQTHPTCLLYTSPSPRDGLLSRMPSSA